MNMPSLRIRAAIAALIVLLLTVLSWHFLLDDALIYYRYIRNALAGNGLVFNPGEHVNALTSPLYTYLLLSVSWLLGGHIHLAATAIFFLTFATACVLAEQLVPFSGLFLASMSYFYSLVGMETSVLIFLILLLIALYRSGRWDFIPLVLTLLLLTRMEAGAFLLAFFLQAYLKRKWPTPKSYLPVAGILVLHILAAYALFHKIIPQSSSAKLGQGLSGYWGAWPTAFLRVRVLQMYFGHTHFTLPFLLVAGIIGIVVYRFSWSGLLLSAVGIMLAFYIFFNLPNYHWYYAPFVLTLVLYSAALMNSRKQLQILMVALILIQIVAAWRVVSSPEPRFADYKRIGAWLDANALPTSTVEACEIGELGWETPRRVVDIIGLTEPKNAQHIAHRDVTSWLREDRPDYIVVHQQPFVFERVALSDPDYEPIPFPGSSAYLLKRKTQIGR